MKHRRLASLLLSLIAISPSAIAFDAPNEETIEAASKPAVQVKKPYKKVHRVKPATARRVKWKRFRYEMGLKAKAVSGSKGKGKGKGKERWIALEDM